MQLVAYGAQDIYLTGNPQITFFKVVYRRHTNFSMESIKQVWDGESLKTDGRCTCTIDRNGDLIHKMYIEIESPYDINTAAPGEPGDWTHDLERMGAWREGKSNPGAFFIKQCSLEIGGQEIVKYDTQWATIWPQLHIKNPEGFVGVGDAASPYQRHTGTGSIHVNYQSPNKFNIPLHFWFCNNPGLALPLIALQYHEVKVILDHRASSVVNNFSGLRDAYLTKNDLWVDYIFLDTDERRRFAQVSHEYLIDQIQYISTDAGTHHSLNFNHPVKEIIWCGDTGTLIPSILHDTNRKLPGVYDAAEIARLPSSSPLNGGGGTTTDALLNPDRNIDTEYINGDPNNSAKWNITLNGHERFAPRDFRYFSRVQIWQHHTGPGGLSMLSQPFTHTTESKSTAEPSQDAGLWGDSILVYSFALKPEEHQPSGTCNFSRIDNAELVCSVATTMPVKIYAINYNVLRIMSGMGGLAYSN